MNFEKQTQKRKKKSAKKTFFLKSALTLKKLRYSTFLENQTKLKNETHLLVHMMFL
jgi:hypothetical protein